MKLKSITFFLSLLAFPCFSQTWLWAKTVTAGNANGYSITTDAEGYVYVTGSFNTPTLTLGSITLTNAGQNNIFIAKYDACGNVIWAKSNGGINSDVSHSICVDKGGNAFITGAFSSPTISFGSTEITSVDNLGNYNLFVAKYDRNGNPVWAKSAKSSGGIYGNEGNCVKADAAGNVFVTGNFNSHTVAFDSFILTDMLVDDIFIVKYDANGNVLWAKSAAGRGYDQGNALGLDAGGNVFVGGTFSSASITFGYANIHKIGERDVFVAKYDANGNFIWAQTAGGATFSYGNSLCTDADGNAYITGDFDSPTITFGPIVLNNTTTDSIASDIFIAKYNTNGNVVWAKSAGGTGYDHSNCISADAAGNLFLTGAFTSANIAFGSTTLSHPVNSTLYPVFVVKCDVSGNVSCASTILNGSINYENNGTISADPYGNAYVLGNFQASPFVVGADTLNLTGTNNIFVAKYTCGGIVNTSNCNPAVEMFVPNAFSPNGDGQNDVLFINANNNIQSLTFEIFNRWGNVVFKTTNVNIGWDGMYNGNKLDSDIFAYILKATLTDGTTVNKKGNISLVK